MKKFINVFIFLFIAGIALNTSNVNAEWIDTFDLTDGRTITVQESGMLSSWAGDVVNVFINSEKIPVKAKIKITWKTPDARVTCGQEIILNWGDYQDFRSRSIMLKRCY